MMKRRSILLLIPSLALLSAEKGCKDTSSQHEPGTNETNSSGIPAPWAAQDDLTDKIKVVTISAWVPKEYGPFFVGGDALDHENGERALMIDHNTETPGGTQFRFTFAYPTHHRVELNMTLRATKAGSADGYIAVRDGKRYNQTRELNGQLQTVLTWYTQR